MSFAADHQPDLVSCEIGTDVEEPRSWVGGMLVESADESFLREVVRAVLVPHVSVKVAHKLMIGGAVHLGPVGFHHALPASSAMRVDGSSLLIWMTNESPQLAQEGRTS